MPDAHFRWGVIGPGKIAHTFAKALEVIDDGVLYAVASRDANRAEEFAQNTKRRNHTHLMKPWLMITMLMVCTSPHPTPSTTIKR